MRIAAPAAARSAISPLARGLAMLGSRTGGTGRMREGNEDEEP